MKSIALKRVALGLVAAVGVMASVVQGASVQLANGTKIEGTALRVNSQGQAILTTAMGIRTFEKGQYIKAVADKPATFDNANQLVKAKKYDEAIAVLEKLITEYRGLEWDNFARVLLAQACVGKGDAAKASDVYGELFKNSPESNADSKLQWEYRSALLQSKKYDKLTRILDEVVSKGSRTDAARAQLMRGDIRMMQEQVELAVSDYLRTAILFEGEKEVAPEAIFKAAKGLETLRDPRAKSMYQRLVNEYDSSPYANEARTKI